MGEIKMGYMKTGPTGLPITTKKQRSIVKAYKAITDRIALKKRINDNLAA